VPSAASKTIVVADPIDAQALARLRASAEKVVDASAGPEALAGALPEAWALVVRSRTKVTDELMGRASRLALIARAGVGVDNVDVPAATRRGVRIVNAPTAATTSVAELTVAFILLLARGLYPRIRETKEGGWTRGIHGHELAGRTVGFVGFGRIAREVARRLAPFGVTTAAYDPFLSGDSVDGTALLDFDSVLARSDFVSLHAALTPENHHLLDARRFDRMRPGAYLVNVARGPLVDEIALLAALQSGRLAGAALDVFEVEPPTRRELLAHPNVLPTPHLGASTPEAQARAGEQVVDEVLRAYRDETLRFLVNPEVERR
jgi:D-3-phosphoglycerate dehydrogenase